MESALLPQKADAVLFLSQSQHPQEEWAFNPVLALEELLMTNSHDPSDQGRARLIAEAEKFIVDEQSLVLTDQAKVALSLLKQSHARFERGELTDEQYAAECRKYREIIRAGMA